VLFEGQKNVCLDEIYLKGIIVELYDVTESSLLFAKEIANYSLLVVASALCLSFSTVLLVLFVSQVRKQNRSLSRFLEVHECRKVNIDQARSLMDSEFDKTRLEIIVHIIKIKQKNDLDNKCAISEKINLLIDVLYANNVSALRKFDFQNKVLSSFMECGWKDVVRRQMLTDCENHEIDIHKLDTAYRNIFLSFKTSYNLKIE